MIEKTIMKTKPFGRYPTPNVYGLQTIQIKHSDENYMQYIILEFIVRTIIFSMGNDMIYITLYLL